MSRLELVCWLAAFAVCGGMELLPVQARADVLGNCNYILRDYSDRGSVMVFDRSGAVTMQMVIDGNQSVYSNLKTTHSTGDQARQEGKTNASFSKLMADAHIFPSDVQSLDVYLAPPDGTGSGTASSVPVASYYAFYGAEKAFLGGFGTIDGEWYVCTWQ